MSAKNIYSNIVQNKLKTTVLMGLFGAFAVAIAYLASLYFGNIYILYAGAFFALAMNVYAYWFSDKIAIKSSGAIPADENEYRELHRIVENLSITAGIPKPKVYIIPDSAPNAFATGRDPKHASVAVTEGLLQILDRSELEAVMAHELSHIKNRDILVSTVAVVLVGFIAHIFDWVLHLSFFSSNNNDEGERHPFSFIVWLVAAFLAPIVAQLMQLAVSRKREFLADSSGALLTRYPEGLARALIKISSVNKPLDNASVATAHLFISNPFGANASSAFNFISKLFSTHPPVEERVRALLGKDAEKFLQALQ